MERKRLLIVYHSQSGSTRRMLDAVLRGAGDTAVEGVDCVVREALAATAEDVLAAQGILLGTPENFGYMSGALKVFFERIYYPCLEHTQGLPYGLFIRAGNDGRGALAEHRPHRHRPALAFGGPARHRDRRARPGRDRRLLGAGRHRRGDRAAAPGLTPGPGGRPGRVPLRRLVGANRRRIGAIPPGASRRIGTDSVRRVFGEGDPPRRTRLELTTNRPPAGRRTRRRQQLRGTTMAGRLDGKVAVITGAASGIGCDVGREADIQALVDAAERRYGRVDIYFSNAGIGNSRGLEADDAMWDKMWRIHGMAHVWAARAVVDKMVARGEGYFLITASAAGLLNIVESADYGVTKHAAVAIAEWLCARRRCAPAWSPATAARPAAMAS